MRARRIVAGISPTAVVGSAADGADVMVLEAALKRRDPPAVHVVLPTPRADFRTASVQENWRDRHDRVLELAPEVGGSVESLCLSDSAHAYRQANARVLERAISAAGEEERVVALVIAAPAAGEMVVDFTERAELRGIPVLRLDPSVDLEARPFCFIAMPFGSKFDAQRKITLDCDLLYSRILVPALENAQLPYRRADEQIDSGVVLQPMIESLSSADLVIADLATGNFNVGWELGLRHLLRARHTLVMLPAGTSPPFDLAPLRHVRYEHEETGISDEAALAAWKQLAPFLQRIGQRDSSAIDSPVAAVMEIDHWAQVRLRVAPDEDWALARQRLALARDLADAEMTIRVVDEASNLDPTQRRLVAAEAGVALVRLGRYREGVGLLAGLVERDVDVSRPDAHVFYAQGLYRPAGASIAELDQAEEVLRGLLIRRPEYPEVWAGLGAINKRRSRRRESDELRRRDIEGAMEAYAHDYERNLDAYYEGINVVACGTVLERVFDDQGAGQRARRTLPAVKLAAELAWERDGSDFWAAVTIAEAQMHEVLLDRGSHPRVAIEAYAEAGALRPSSGALDSSLTQLEWLARQGVDHWLLDAAGEALAQAAGADYARRQEP